MAKTVQSAGWVIHFMHKSETTLKKYVLIYSSVKPDEIVFFELYLQLSRPVMFILWVAFIFIQITNVWATAWKVHVQRDAWPVSSIRDWRTLLFKATTFKNILWSSSKQICDNRSKTPFSFQGLYSPWDCLKVPEFWKLFFKTLKVLEFSKD